MNQTQKDFLIEIGTEELPPKSISGLVSNFSAQLELVLNQAKLTYRDIQLYTTPRRIAVLIKSLLAQQPDRYIEKTGPSLSTAYDAQGNPTPQALGFAKSCGVDFSTLQVKETPKGNCLSFTQQIKGENIFALAPKFIAKALDLLPISRPMNWGDMKTPFIRPVHWILLMYGDEVIPCELFGLKTDNKTFGHRFHFPAALEISNPDDYATLLSTKGFVLPNFQQRKEHIRHEITTLASQKGQVVINEDLLDEVTGLVEWPTPLLCRFHERFLKIPPEALTSVINIHQKNFPIIDRSKQNLLPFFIAVANIESQNPQQVVVGNERVMHARLADGEFFYHADLIHSLPDYLERLKGVIFQHKLGTMWDKANRLSKLASLIAKELDYPVEAAERAGLLSKADLVTQMVGEFPELQGIMGYYYALKDKELTEVANAIKEHYLPRYSGDELPKTSIGTTLALADRLDTLVGIFGINQAPTGEKDPFALRRAAMGTLRIMIENRLPLDLKKLLLYAQNGYEHLENPDTVDQVLDFIIDRLRAWYQERGTNTDVYSSVLARYPTSPLDFDNRIQAVQHFQQLPEAHALAAANKRVKNILKQTEAPQQSQLNHALLQEPAEKQLATVLEQMSKEVEKLCIACKYTEALTVLAKLQQPIDNFFDQVRVMVEDEKIKENRLTLLISLRNLFLKVADVSLLHDS